MQSISGAQVYDVPVRAVPARVVPYVPEASMITSLSILESMVRESVSQGEEDGPQAMLSEPEAGLT